jgi:glutamyl-tRNA reductase
MIAHFKAISLSYQNASLEVRGQVSLNEGDVKKALIEMRDLMGISEALIVSTCNRTEIYYLSETSLVNEFVHLLAVQKGISSEALLPFFKIIDDGESATLHLFEVSTGLHSQVIGDSQISKQIKQSYQWSVDVNMAGIFLHRLMHTIFATNKRITHETIFRKGPVSTSSNVTELIKELSFSHANLSILILGLGDIGIDVCKNLVENGYENIVLCNRTRHKAHKLGQELNLSIVDFDKLPDMVQHTDIVVSCVQTDKPVITIDMMVGCQTTNDKYFIDLAVPRSIQEGIEEMSGVFLYNIDDLQIRRNVQIEQRLSAVPTVRKIIAESMADFMNWVQTLIILPQIRELKNTLERMRKEVLTCYAKEINGHENQIVEKITSSLVQKIVKTSVMNLKAACKHSETPKVIETLHDIFDLDKRVLM